MNKKKVLIVIGVIFGVLIVGALLLPLLVNVDHFRPEVQSQASAALGREVTIGELKLAVFSGGVTANDISIADDPAFSQQAFVKAKSLDVGVDLMPLIFSKALHVNTLTLQEPEIHLVKNAAGKWNYSTVGTKSASAPAKRGRRQTAEPAAKPAESTPAAAQDFSIGKLEINNGRVLVSSGSGKAHTYEDVNVTAKNISPTSVVPFTVSAKSPGEGKVSVDGRAGPLNREDASQTPLEASIEVEHMDLGATGFLDPSSGIAGALDFKGNIKSDGKTAKTSGNAKVDKLKLVKGGQPAREPVNLDYAADYDLLAKNGAVSKGDILLGKTAAKLTGNFDGRGETMVVHMKLNGNNMPISELEGLLPAFGVVLPAGAALAGGTATANLSLDGPIDHLVTTGPINVANTKLTGFNLGEKMKGIAALAGINTGSETVIQQLSSTLRVAPEGIQASNLNLILPQIGAITGNGAIGANNGLNFKMLAKLNNGGGVMGGLSQITSMGQSKGQLPFLIQGTTNNPVFLPDVANALGQTLTGPAKGAKGVGGILGGFFGQKK
jgi:AsmA protein